MTIGADGVGQKVLVLDDDPLVGRLITRTAASLGHEAHYCSDPTEFFSMHSAWHPDVIVLDLVMGEMDGLEVLTRLAHDHSSSRIIISSGTGGRVMDAASRYAEANGLAVTGLLPKPFQRAQFAALLAAQHQGPDPQSPPGATSKRGWTTATFTRDLRHALTTDEIKVAFQPKVSCVDGSVAGFEALVRWLHPTRGIVPPGSFVPIAEEAGLARLLTDRVLRLALRWFASVPHRDALHLAVNISATELSEPSLDERILAACVTAGVPANQLILEVTETSAMVDPVTSLQLLTRLRLEGFKVSIDDFGTGYSSMHQLARLPFSEIKIDQSFVKDIPDNPQSVSIARTIINLAHSLGMTVIAEGVENERALGALTELGCDLAQGYFISRPLYPDQIDSWLALQRQPAQQVNDAQQVDPASPLARLLNHDFYRGEDAADKAQQP